MEIEKRDLKHVTVVKVSGRVDSATAPDLEKSLQDLIDAGRCQLVLDLQSTDYMSSAGLRVLVAQNKKAKHAGGDLRLGQPSTRVKEVLELAGLDVVFTVYDDMIEAVGSY